MNAWILYIVLFGSNDGSSTMSSQEFSSRESCAAAEKVVRQQYVQHYNGRYANSFCLKK